MTLHSTMVLLKHTDMISVILIFSSLHSTMVLLKRNFTLQLTHW